MCVLALCAASCSQKRSVVIEGVVENAKGEKLYLEHLAGGRPEMIDTIMLDEKGKFRFKPEVEDGPDYFMLRISTQTIPLAVDTLLTPIKVKADMKRFGSDYEVSDDLNKRLKEASRKGNDLRRDVLKLNASFNAGEIGEILYRDSLLRMVRSYKQVMLTEYIYKDPADPVSNYVLFESVRGLSIFDPLDPKDNRAFGAVATGWQAFYPNSPRLKTLEKVTREGQAIRRREAMMAQQGDSIGNSPITVSSFFDLELTDHHDKVVKLSSLVDNKSIILLDFTAYYMVPAAHNVLLNSMYEKYKDKGLKIYQVCLDLDENFWKTSANNVPWTVVRDTETLYDTQGNVAYSRAAGTYNVQQIPMIYLLDKDGSVKVRVEHDNMLEGEIQKLLK